MVSLTFFGGVAEIGGNKFLIEDGDTRVFLDFGMSFNRSGRFFSEFLGPRKCNGLGDFFSTGLLPDIPGVYRSDYLRHMGREPEDCQVDAVLISHAHMDHAAYIHHLRKDIELNMSPGTYAVLKTLQDTGAGSFNDLLEYVPSFQLRPKKRGDGYTKVTKRQGFHERPLKIIESGKKYSLGDVEVTPFEVDHSLPGATSYLINTSEGTIFYTGDFRFHGYSGEKTLHMVESVAEESVDLLLTEGTRISDPLGTTEQDVYVQAKSLIDGCKGLSVINFPPRDLARFLTFYRIAKDTGRKFVIGFKQAYLLNEFNKICDDYPTIDDHNICLFADRKGWGIAGRTDLPSNIEGVCIPENICEQDYGTWEREFLLEENCVCYRDLKDHRKYMFYCNYFQLNELIDVKPVTGSIYLRSVTEPFDEEMELDAQRVDNWLDLFGLQQFGRKSDDMLHASGHASGQEIRDMIQKIQPKKIITIHTEQPEYLKSSFNNVFTVKQGEKIEL